MYIGHNILESITISECIYADDLSLVAKIRKRK